MSWSTTPLRYGWAIAAGVTLAAATIYVAGNQRHRVNQADMAEIVLGTAERCLAAGVTPPSYVAQWISNSWATNGTVAAYTNAMANTIGWRMDRAMLTNLDATIKALVPMYVNTGTMAALTVTGLWASLGIGDRTKQFTATPATIATNGQTNAATYGALSGRLYETNLIERYMVLNALSASTVAVSSSRSGRGALLFGSNTWENAKGRAEAQFNSQTNNQFPAYYFEAYTEGQLEERYYATMARRAGTVSVSCPTDFTHTVTLWIRAQGGPFYGTSSNFVSNVFDGFADLPVGTTTNWSIFGSTNGTSFVIGDTNYALVDWCGEPTSNEWNSRGYSIRDMRAYVAWGFNYCTNKYW